MSGMHEESDNVVETSEDKKQTTETESDEKEKASGKGLLHVLLRMASDILLIGFILVTLLNYVQNTDDQIRRAARKPEPFFSGNTTVRDYWNGDVFTGFKDAAVFEGSFFMFYAAWDRECMEARQTLETVAEFYRGTDTMIAAVNCWYPTSDCAKEFGGRNGTGNILPLFVYYPRHFSGIQYRGVTSATHIIRFIQRARFPIHHLQSMQHFQHLQVEYSSILLGYLPNTTTHLLSPNHKGYLTTAYSLTEVYSENPLGLGVVTSETLAKQLHLHASQPVRLFSHNSTYVYPNKTVDPEKLLVWTVRNVSPPTSWLHLSGTKSKMLKRALEGGTGNTLLMFSPRTHLKDDRVFNILRQVSADYINCDKLEAVDSLVERLKRRGEELETHSCSTFSSHSTTTGCSSTSPRTSPTSCQLKRWSYDRHEENFPACNAAVCAYNGTQCTDRLRILNNLETSDLNVKLAISDFQIEKERERLVFSEEEIFSNAKSLPVDIRALGCNTNKTLKMYRVDSTVHGSLLTSLGLAQHPLPLPVIISSAEEAVYIPQTSREGYFEEDLRNFIFSWHQGTLAGKQGFRSTDDNSFIRYKDSESSSEEYSVIKEVSAATFSEVITADRDVVLFYTSSFCSKCSVASFAFHSVKMYLENVTNIRFLMIDAAKNDLNWQFTALTYPSILYFPKNRSDLSRAFPSDSRLNVKNLLSFVVSNLNPRGRLQLALLHCDTDTRSKLRVRCGHIASQLSGQLQRSGSSLPGYLRRKLTRRLSYVRSLLNTLSKLDDSIMIPGDSKAGTRKDIIKTFLKQKF